MFTVYALHSPKYDKIYIGYSSDLDARMLSHNKLGTKGWTVRYRPWKIVHTEEFATKTDAMKREKELKSAKRLSGRTGNKLPSDGLSARIPKAFGRRQAGVVDIRRSFLSLPKVRLWRNSHK